MGHIQVDMYSGKLDWSLKLWQEAGLTHLGVISVTDVASERRKAGQLIDLLFWGSVDTTLSSHQAHVFVGH